MNQQPLFKNRSYCALFSAQVVSLVGTGVGTVALSLLAWSLAGENAGSVLGVALALKMVAYVFLAPVFGAYAHKLPRKQWLIMLDIIRLLICLSLPFVTEIWQIYILIFLMNACSAGFTPVYQSMLPQVLPDQQQYIKALSFSRLAYDLEQMVSPMLAAAVLTTMAFENLFFIDALTFLISACFLMLTVIPKARTPDRKRGIINNLSFGIRSYLATPRLRALWAIYLTVASGSAMLIVNTVVYTREVLQAGEQQTALAMSAAGFGSMVIALLLPGWLKRYSVRPFMMAGAFLITASLFIGFFLPGWTGFLALWLIIGMGLSLIQTPAAALVKRSCHDDDAPAYFSANFSLSHLCWFATYLLAGWSSSQFGLVITFVLMGGLALAGCLLALILYPKNDPEELEHEHIADDGSVYRHTHHFVIDREHTRWPT